MSRRSWDRRLMTRAGGVDRVDQNPSYSGEARLFDFVGVGVLVVLIVLFGFRVTRA